LERLQARHEVLAGVMAKFRSTGASLVSDP
jgi:hypothetical protein